MNQINKGRIKRLGRPVSQYDLNGNFIKLYPSAREASRITGINHSNISEAARGHRRSARGFHWKNGNNIYNQGNICQHCGTLTKAEDLVFISINCLQKLRKIYESIH